MTIPGWIFTEMHRIDTTGNFNWRAARFHKELQAIWREFENCADAETASGELQHLSQAHCLHIESASRSPPGLCSDNVVCAPFLDEASARICVYEFGIPFDIILGDLGWSWDPFWLPYDHFRHTLGTHFALQNRPGRPRSPKGNHHGYKITLLGIFLSKKSEKVAPRGTLSSVCENVLKKWSQRVRFSGPRPG